MEHATIESVEPVLRCQTHLIVPVKRDSTVHILLCVTLCKLQYYIIWLIGLLSSVTEIRRGSSTLSWEAPFSLDLTGVDPDIVYCVEVYNIICGVDDLVVGDCNVNEPRFVDNRLQQGYIYRITITPRSNGQDAQNGTSNTKEGNNITSCLEQYSYLVNYL